MTPEIKKKIEAEADKRTTHIVKGPTEWVHKDVNKKQAFMSFGELTYNLAQQEITKLDTGLKNCVEASNENIEELIDEREAG